MERWQVGLCKGSYEEVKSTIDMACGWVWMNCYGFPYVKAYFK